MKYRFIIGIDPDLEASGVAIWDAQEQIWSDVSLVPLEDMGNHLDSAFFPYPKSSTVIYVEAGWKNAQANFRRGHKSSVSESIAMRVGMNHATSILTARMLRKQGWEVVEIAPLGKAGGLLKKGGTWTKAGKDYIRQNSGYTGKLTSGEVCDSVYIAMHFRPRVK